MELTHKGTKTLETSNLIMRQFCIQDAQEMFNNWAGDDEVTKFLTWPSHPNVEETEKVIQYWVDNYKTNEQYNWAIILKKISQPIGSIGLVNLDNHRLSGEIGYCIGKSFWHKGITTEALSRVLEYLFSEVNFNRIEARHDLLNPNSGKVMEKVGMVFEGTLRQAGINRQNQFYNCNLYSVLKSEWSNTAL